MLLADVVVDRYQLYESRAAGADGVVLIVAAFDDEGEALGELYGEALDIGLDVLLEVGRARTRSSGRWSSSTRTRS